MALISSDLAFQLEMAFLVAQQNPFPTATTELANSIAMAVHNYLIKAQVTTTVTGLTASGVNTSTIVAAVPTPGGISPPGAVVTGTGTGFLT